MINLNLWAEMPASSKISFALAECSRSESIEVNVASFGAPSFIIDNELFFGFFVRFLDLLVFSFD